MPRQVSQSKSKSSQVERARRFLTGGGVLREDSDDELGFEDYPWEWIYARRSPSSVASSGYEENGTRKGEIVGARMGGFECRLGDCVLLKAEGANHEAWIGIISEFHDDVEEKGCKGANFMWFSTEKEIRNKQKKRTDAMQVRSDPRSIHKYIILLKLVYRMKYILPLHGISIRWHLSTAKLPLSHQVRFISAIPLVRFLGLPKITAKCLFVAEAAIPGQPPIRMNLSGRVYIVV